MSFGYDNYCGNQLDGGCNLRYWIGQAINSGVIVVASAGNHNLDHAENPAGWPEVIGVGAYDPEDKLPSGAYSYKRASYSNRGPGVDIFTPGTIYTVPTAYESCYSYYKCAFVNFFSLGNTKFFGTSAAAPFMAGTAALMKQINPSIKLILLT